MGEKPTDADAFCDSLRDVSVVLAKLAPHCQTVQDAIAMVNLALENDGQCRLLQSVVLGKGK